MLTLVRSLQTILLDKRERSLAINDACNRTTIEDTSRIVGDFLKQEVSEKIDRQLSDKAVLRDLVGSMKARCMALIDSKRRENQLLNHTYLVPYDILNLGIEKSARFILIEGNIFKKTNHNDFGALPYFL